MRKELKLGEEKRVKRKLQISIALYKAVTEERKCIPDSEVRKYPV